MKKYIRLSFCLYFFGLTLFILLYVTPVRFADAKDYSLLFNGEDNYVDCGTSESLNIVAPLTLEAWIKPTDWNIDSGISSIADKGKFSLYIKKSNSRTVSDENGLIFEMYHEDKTYTQFKTADNSIKLNTWQHIAVTYDGIETVKIYINGEDRPFTSVYGLPSGAIEDNTEEHLFIGDNASHSSKFKGAIDEVRIWNITRSRYDIQSALYVPLSVDNKGLAGYWMMTESEDILTDYSGNGNNGIIYGATLSTAYCQAVRYPKIKLVKIGYVTSTTASVSGEVLYDGGAPVTEKGVCWNTSGTPMIEKNDRKVYVKSSSIGYFNVTITELKPGTAYYIRIYVTNCGGKTAYGVQESFVTPVKPVVITSEISMITDSSASCGGDVTDDGNGKITARGSCWSTEKNPALNSSATCSSDGTGAGIFTSEMTKLISGTAYFVRAYVTNGAGTSYGEEKSFTTLVKPAVTTSAVIYITPTTAYSGGNVTDDGGYTVTARGVCWNTLKSPGIDNGAFCYVNGSGEGSFSSFMNNLMPDTTYYVRAYATNQGGTSYGNEREFKTPFIPGDINNDGSVRLDDAVICFKILSNINLGDIKISLKADVNGDKKISFEDAIYILRKILQ